MTDIAKVASWLPQITLDITSFRQRKPEELKDAIYDAFKQYDSSIIGTLPSRITMSQRQYNILLKRPEIVPMWLGDQEYQFYRVEDSKGRLKCVMELHVQKDEDLNKDVPVVTVDKLETKD